MPEAMDNLHIDIPEIPDGLLNWLRSPLFPAVLIALALSLLMVRFLYPRWKDGRLPEFSPALAYTRPESPPRRELLRLYSKAEKQLKGRIGAKRLPWQTAMEYTGMAAGDGSTIHNHLQWFVKAVWWAAYSPSEPDDSLVKEGRERLSSLRKALKENPLPGGA